MKKSPRYGVLDSFSFAWASRLLLALGLFLAYLLFFRGHNLPGGGFIAGLLVALSIAIRALVVGVSQLERRVYFRPRTLMIFGWVLALGSAFPALLSGQEFMKGLWFGSSWVPFVGWTKWGTVVIFDLGVFFLVVGMVLRVVFSLLEEDSHAP